MVSRRGPTIFSHIALEWKNHEPWKVMEFGDPSFLSPYHTSHTFPPYFLWHTAV